MKNSYVILFSTKKLKTLIPYNFFLTKTKSKPFSIIPKIFKGSTGSSPHDYCLCWFGYLLTFDVCLYKPKLCKWGEIGYVKNEITPCPWFGRLMNSENTSFRFVTHNSSLFDCIKTLYKKRKINKY